MKLPSIQQVWLEAGRTAKRFPLVLIATTIGTIAALILVDHDYSKEGTFLNGVLLASALGAMLLTGAVLVGEKGRRGKLIFWAMQILSILLLVGYAFTIPLKLVGAPLFHVVQFQLFCFALALLVSVGPFRSPGELNGFWQYNKTLVFRILTSLLFAGVLYAGLAIALAALDHLFGVDIAGKRYFELWVLIAGIFAPWFFLAGVPEDLDALESVSEYSKGIKVFAQYILSPIALVYFVILYAYIVKILLEWNWPKGWVAELILGFAAVGLSTLVLLYPVRERPENKWIRVATRWFFRLMIPLIVVLILAVWRRITDYGVTEERYFGIALAVWLAVVVVYFLVSKAKSIKILPGSMCILLLVTSVGPWGAFSVSENSQIGKLRMLLERNAMLVNEKIEKAPATLPSGDKEQIWSIVHYLNGMHGLEDIRPWFEEKIVPDSTGIRPKKLSTSIAFDLMGVEYAGVWRSAASDQFIFNSGSDNAVDVAGFDHWMPRQQFGSSPAKPASQGSELLWRTNTELDTIMFFLRKDSVSIDSIEISIQPLMTSLLSQYGNANVEDVPPDQMSVGAASQTMRVKMFVNSFSFRRDGDKLIPIWYSANIFYSVGSRTE